MQDFTFCKTNPILMRTLLGQAAGMKSAGKQQSDAVD
jgi:hypothetical protein